VFCKSSGVTSFFAGAQGSSGFVDGPLTSARFTNPTGIVADTAGTLYVGDYGSNIRMISTNGIRWMPSMLPL
jgi:hypothetical protein